MKSTGIKNRNDLIDYALRELQRIGPQRRILELKAKAKAESETGFSVARAKIRLLEDGKKTR
ncbi:MAG: hypothetical protein NTX50_27035 [Candidatus Sumerlaeota bacterium]|nr:hypothetical protein [Candidatus Sumerlaeota bacterium]